MIRKLTVVPAGLLLLLPVVLTLVLCWQEESLAEPAWGGNCLACHGALAGGAVLVFGEDGIVDPDEGGTGAPDRGPLPVYRAYRGESKRLEVTLADLADGDTYAVELKRLRFPGVEQGGALTFSGDCDWPEWGEQPQYYTQPAIKHTWPGGPPAASFDINVQDDAGFDYYDLVFAVAGKRAVSGELFYAEQHFYLQVVFLVGDADCDGAVDFGDVNPFTLAVTQPAAYAGEYPDCTIESCDTNGDGRVDAGDINPFVDLLLGRES